MTNLFTELWEVAITMIEYIDKVWDWLTDRLIIDIPISIPVILENGIRWDTGITPISLLGVGLVGMILYWFIWGG